MAVGGNKLHVSLTASGGNLFHATKNRSSKLKITYVHKINVLFIAHYERLYGANRSLINLIEGLMLFYPDKYSIHVILPKKGGMEDALIKLNIPCTIIKFSFDATNTIPVNFFRRMYFMKWHANRQYKAIKKIRQIINRHQIDIVHSNSSVISLGFLAAKLSHVPHLWHIREFPELNYGYSFVYGKRLQTAMLRATQKVIVISSSVMDYCQQNFKVSGQLIYNGLYLQGKEPGKAKKAEGQPPVMGVVGNIIPAKNQMEALQLLMQLLPKYPQLQLRLVGEITDEDYGKQLNNYIAAHQLQSHVQFTGFVENMKVMYEEMDILVSCAAHEAFGRTLVEAGFNGIPVIVRRGGGVEEIVTDASIGYLYNHPDELLDCAQKVLDKLSQDKGNTEPWILPATLQRFTINRYVSEMDAVIESTVKDYRSKSV